jgi:hypothetical protein
MRRCILTSTLFSVLFLAQTVQAWDFHADLRKKQEAKDAKRWSLSEWLAQKSKNKLMDTWLGYNLPSPYEFYLSVDTSSLEREVDTNGTLSSQTFRNYRGSFGAFVTAVGLHGEYESSDEELQQWKALFMVRLLGSSDQSTNFTIHYGLMGREENDDPTQFQVGGGRINLYLIKAFALTGQYDYIFNAESENGVEQEGFRYEAGAFIEFGALRFYGSWFEEVIEILNAPSPTEQTRQGILFGARLYF